MLLNQHSVAGQHISLDKHSQIRLVEIQTILLVKQTPLQKLRFRRADGAPYLRVRARGAPEKIEPESAKSLAKPCGM